MPWKDDEIGRGWESVERDKLLVANAMMIHGGGFMRLLGEALLHADAVNTVKIKMTWSNDWNKYLQIGREDEASE